jgi:ABC-type bacteriocin/lantibiotic exporter with double-glycine peptidase domain
MPSFLQRDSSDCGVTCLAYLLHHHRRPVSVAVLRQQAGTDKSGTTALGLVEAATKFGFAAKGIQCDFEALERLDLPLIAHLKVQGDRQHFVAICGRNRKGLKVMDPALGRVETWTQDRFRAAWTGVVVVVAPGFDARAGAGKSGGGRLAALLLQHKAVIGEAFLGAVLGTCLTLSTTIYVQKIVDNVIGDGNGKLLNLLAVGMLAILGFRLLLNYLQALLLARAGQKVDAALVVGYYRHLLYLPQSFFETMQVGEVNSRVNDAVKIRAFLNTTVVSLLLNPLMIVFALVGMFFYAPKLALLSLALIPLNGLVYYASDWRNKRFQRAIMERSAAFNAQLVESLHAMPLVRSFHLEESTALRIESKFVGCLKTNWQSTVMTLAVNAGATLVTQGYSIVLLWLGASEVLEAKLTAGELMSCYALSSYITNPMMALIGINTSVREALIATERLYEVIDLEREKDTGTIQLEREMVSSVRLAEVSFKYPGRAPLLKDISLNFPAGSITALVGPSGCGKSTLLSLLHRMHLPTRGRIHVGDFDMTYIGLSSLRRMITLVPQRIELLTGTVLENLAPGDPEPDLRRLVEICRRLGVLGFIESLPQGFYTKVTESGSNMSGGQRQRLAVVRALYLDAPVLLLDEPSASLDAAAQDQLIEVLRELRDQGKIIIVAAHNQRVVEMADAVVEIERGAVKSRTELSFELVEERIAEARPAPLSAGA